MVVWTVPGHCTDRADGNPRLLHLDPAHLRHRKQNLRDADPDLVRRDHGRSGCENGFCMRYSIDKPRPFAKTGSGQQRRGKVEQKEHRVCICAGDWIFGDSDGIIVGARSEIEPLMPTAEAIVRNEVRERASVYCRSFSFWI
jgi:hypothetical protein